MRTRILVATTLLAAGCSGNASLWRVDVEEAVFLESDTDTSVCIVFNADGRHETCGAVPLSEVISDDVIGSADVELLAADRIVLTVALGGEDGKEFSHEANGRSVRATVYAEGE